MECWYTNPMQKVVSIILLLPSSPSPAGVLPQRARLLRGGRRGGARGAGEEVRREARGHRVPRAAGHRRSAQPPRVVDAAFIRPCVFRLQATGTRTALRLEWKRSSAKHPDTLKPYPQREVARPDALAPLQGMRGTEVVDAIFTRVTGADRSPTQAPAESGERGALLVQQQAQQSSDSILWCFARVQYGIGVLTKEGYIGNVYGVL